MAASRSLPCTTISCTIRRTPCSCMSRATAIRRSSPPRSARRSQRARHLEAPKQATQASAEVPTGSTQGATLNTAAIDQALGFKGKLNGAVYAVGIPRTEPPREGETALPPAMGSAIAINFEPTGEGKAATTGDFVLTADEVNPIVQA